ncbi:MAG: DUF935 family protein [Kluyvera sp.]|uniref:phage portal protein family protein n=1 Tax=Kluyvera sp. TaxID=1538228 RepID=UPI003A861684
MSKVNPATQLFSRLPYAAADVFSSYYPVPVSLGAAGFEFSDYYWMSIDAMLMDDEIVSDLLLRRTTAMMAPFQITGTPDDIAWAEEMLSELDLENLLRECLHHAEYGFNLIELDWVRDGSNVRPVYAERRHPRAFRWGKDGKLLYSSTGNVLSYSDVPTGKVIPVVRDGSRERPYGQSVLEPAWATWQTKWEHVEKLERLADKYSVPTTIALANEGNASQTSLEEIAGTMAVIENGGSVALSGVSEVVQLTASGKASELMAVIEKYDNKLCKLITGQTLTGTSQQYGSRALGEVHERAALRISADDAQIVFNTLNRTLLRWLFALNGRAGGIAIRFDKKAFGQMVQQMQGNGSAGAIQLSNPAGNNWLQRAWGLNLW